MGQGEGHAEAWLSSPRALGVQGHNQTLVTRNKAKATLTVHITASALCVIDPWWLFQGASSNSKIKGEKYRTQIHSIKNCFCASPGPSTHWAAGLAQPARGPCQQPRGPAAGGPNPWVMSQPRAGAQQRSCLREELARGGMESSPRDLVI